MKSAQKITADQIPDPVILHNSSQVAVFPVYHQSRVPGIEPGIKPSPLPAETLIYNNKLRAAGSSAHLAFANRQRHKGHAA